MKRLLLVLMTLGLLGAVPQAASASCRWFGTQLECTIGGSQLLIGTQAAAEPAYARAVRPQPLQGSDGLLDYRAAPEWALRLDLQNFGMDRPADSGLCRTFGDKTYCY